MTRGSRRLPIVSCKWKMDALSGTNRTGRLAADLLRLVAMTISKQKRIISVTLGSVGLVVALAVFLVKTGAPVVPAFPRTQGPPETNWHAVAPGRVEPRSGEIKVAPVVIGRIAGVLVKVNDVVFAGE